MSYSVDSDAEYVQYHAVMCAISALSPQRFRGFGPGDPDKVYTVLLATRHDTLMSVASHGLRALPFDNLSTEIKDGSTFNYSRSKSNEVSVDKSKDVYGNPYFLNESVFPLSKFDGLNALYSSTISYVKCEISMPASVYGASRLRALTAEKRSEKRNRYREPAGIRHAKKRRRRTVEDDEDFVVQASTNKKKVSL